jgi:2-polyprenyl-6-methoxyphenol hydroxylase-like FAD-dependent oxidoreductase
MARLCGEHAIVIGAGIGGLAAAAALSSHFQQVTVLERDEIGDGSLARPGTPHSRQLHGLLTGGLQGLCRIFPNFDRDLADAGAVPVRVSRDIRAEIPGFDPFPQRDFGWINYTMTRSLIEQVMRQRLLGLPNVVLRDRCRVLELVAEYDGTVNALRCDTDGSVEALRANLVIDASARGTLTLSLLKAVGAHEPEQTRIGIDMVYASTTFEASKLPADWRMAITSPEAPSRGKTGYLFPVEGGRWMALVGERHVPTPPDDVGHFLNLARQLRTSTLYDTVKDARPLDKVHRFVFAENSWRHYETLKTFPYGLLPLGDAICRFNPIYGQGMSVAIIEAEILGDLLHARAGNRDPLAGLAQSFLAAIYPLIEGAWSMSTVPDFVNPATRGEPPKDIENSLRFSRGLMRLAARDAAIHELMLGVRYLMKPASALRDPELVRRVQAALADA